MAKLIPTSSQHKTAHPAPAHAGPGLFLLPLPLPCLSFSHVQMSFSIQLPPEGSWGGGTTNQWRKKHLVMDFSHLQQPWGTPHVVLPHLCPSDGLNHSLVLNTASCRCRSLPGRADAELLYMLAAL